MQSSLSRREFLARAALTGVALQVVRPVRAADEGMFVSLNSSLTASGKLEWPEFARLAASVGYGGVDVSLDGVRKAGADQTRALLAGLKIRPGHRRSASRFAADEPAFQEGLKQLGEAAKLAADIGCPGCRRSCRRRAPHPKRNIEKSSRTAWSRCPRPAASKVRLGLEFLGPLHFRSRQPYEFIWKMDELLEFTKECGANIGLVLDAWHWHHAGATAADILAAGKYRIVTVHVSDAKAQPPEEVRDNSG